MGRPLQKRDVIKNYDREGRNYDNIRYGRTRGGRFFSEIELLNTLRLVRRGTVLHIGTATGRVSQYLISHGSDYVGLELSHVMARITKEKLNGSGMVVRGDAEHLPFREEMFDNVVCVRSFHFLPDPIRFLMEARRVARRKGRVIVSFEKNVPTRHLLERLKILPKPLLRRSYYLISQVVQMTEQTGFASISAGNVTKLPLLLYWRTNQDKVLRSIHPKIPGWLGTIGIVVADKA